MDSGLYVHVPFCVRKCGYCAFFSRPAEPGLVAAWFAGIERELAALPAGFAPTSVFFGGGTPTALDERDLARLLDFAQRPTTYDGGRVWLVVRNRGANPDAWRQPFGPWLADLVAQPQQPPAGLRWEATLPDAFVWEIVPRR